MNCPLCGCPLALDRGVHEDTHVCTNPDCWLRRITVGHEACHNPDRDFGSGIPEGAEFVMCLKCGAWIRPETGVLVEVCDKPCGPCADRETCSGALEYGAHDEEKETRRCPMCESQMLPCIDKDHPLMKDITYHFTGAFHCMKCGHEEKVNP